MLCIIRVAADLPEVRLHRGLATGGVLLCDERLLVGVDLHQVFAAGSHGLPYSREACASDHLVLRRNGGAGDGNLLHGGFCLVVGEVTCPDDYYLPTGIHQFVVNPCIPSSIPFYLVLPESGVGLGQYELSASLMSVPETAVDENRRSVAAHHYVRLARHALDIEPISVSVRPQPSANGHFRFGRLAANMRHAAVTLLWG